MNARFALIVLFMSCSILVPVHGGDEQWLAYRCSPQARNVTGEGDSLSINLARERPVDVDLPQFKDRTPLFGKWQTPMVKGGFIWLAFDRSRKNGPYDLLYIDSNANGSLKDETSIAAWQRQSYTTQFGPAALTFPGDDGPVTYHLNLEFYGYDRDRARAYVSSGGWYEGTVKIGDQSHECWLIDYNVNGTFNDKALDPSECDRIRVKKAGKWSTYYTGNFLPVHGKIYGMAIARDGAYVKFAEATDVKFGQFRAPASIKGVILGGENGKFNLEPKSDALPVPVGKYRIVEWTIEQKDDKGRAWRIKAYGSDDKSTVVITEAGEQCPAIGLPISSKLDVQGQGKTYQIRHEFTGQLGESIDVTCNKERPAAPKVHIVNADGSYNKTFSLEYG